MKFTNIEHLLSLEDRQTVPRASGTFNFVCIFRLETFGPSGVRALPLAAGINVGGHYKWHFFLFLSSLFFSPGSLLILLEGIVVGFQIFAWAPKKK